MPLLYDISDETKQLWDSIRESLRGPVESVDKATKWPFSDSVAGPGLLSAFDMTYPKDTKDAFVGGILGLAPGISNAQSEMAKLYKVLPENLEYKGSTDSGHWFTIKDKSHPQYNSTEIWPAEIKNKRE